MLHMRRTPVTPSMPGQYDLYHLAYLAGGLRRVIDTALVALLQRGYLRLQPTGELRAVQTTPRHPVEAAVLELVGPRPCHSIAAVRWRLESDQRLTALEQRLTADGLLPGRFSLRLPGHRLSPALTAAGRRALRQWRLHPPTDPVAEGTDAMPVALRGVEAVPDPELKARLGPPDWRTRTAAPWNPNAAQALTSLPPGGMWGNSTATDGNGAAQHTDHITYGSAALNMGHGGFGGH